MVRVYEEKPEVKDKPTKKATFLRLRQEGVNAILEAVNEDGGWEADILMITSDGVKLCEDAEGALSCDDFDTSFTDWDSRGRIKLIEHDS